MATAPTAPTLVQEPARQLERVRPSRSLWSDGWRRLTRNKMAVTGLIYIGFLAVGAIFAPVIAPHNPVETDVVNAGTYRQAAWISDPNPMRAGSWDYPLGTDSVGRDVFSRLVYGTRVSLVVGLILGPMMEQSMRQALTISQGEWSTFFVRPLSGSLLAIALLLLAPLVLWALLRRPRSS